MGIHDRPYWQGNGGGGMGRGMGQPMGGGMGFALPKLTPMVKLLLIINAAVFVLQLFADRRGAMSALFGVTGQDWWQLWRYITFQFLHSGPWHIILNMLGVYFFGTMLERTWGSARFLRFYLGCGVVAGIAYVVIGKLAGFASFVPIIGASGGVFGLLLVCAVFFPQFRLILFIFPVPIRLAAVLVFGVMIFTVLGGLTSGNPGSAMSDVAHLGGAVAAAFYIWVLPKVGVKVRQVSRQAPQVKSRNGTWKKKMQEQQDFDKRIDEILEKIQKGGIGSISHKEQKLLKEATKRQREKDQNLRRM